MEVKDAFNNMKPSAQSKTYCGILPYFGSPQYRDELLPMVLTISPAKCKEHVNLLLENISHRTQFITIKDVLLVHSLKKYHRARLESLSQPFVKHI